MLRPERSSSALCSALVLFFAGFMAFMDFVLFLEPLAAFGFFPHRRHRHGLRFMACIAFVAAVVFMASVAFASALLLFIVACFAPCAMARREVDRGLERFQRLERASKDPSPPLVIINTHPPTLHHMV